MKTSLRTILSLSAFVIGMSLRAAGIDPPVPVRTVAPAYPAAMRSSGTSGVVLVNCRVDEKGAVIEAVVVKATHEAFEKPAISAVEQWKFRPAMKDGQPCAMMVQVPVKFTVD